MLNTFYIAFFYLSTPPPPPPLDRKFAKSAAEIICKNTTESALKVSAKNTQINGLTVLLMRFKNRKINIVQYKNSIKIGQKNYSNYILNSLLEKEKLFFYFL